MYERENRSSTYKVLQDLFRPLDVFRIPLPLDPQEAYGRVENFILHDSVTVKSRKKKLTHSDDVRIGVVHPLVILLCPGQTDPCPILQFLVLLTQSFPFSHEKFETSNGTAQDRR